MLHREPQGNDGLGSDANNAAADRRMPRPIPRCGASARRGAGGLLLQFGPDFTWAKAIPNKYALNGQHYNREEQHGRGIEGASLKHLMPPACEKPRP
jgi:hypothetical protein